MFSNIKSLEKYLDMKGIPIKEKIEKKKTILEQFELFLFILLIL